MKKIAGGLLAEHLEGISQETNDVSNKRANKKHPLIEVQEFLQDNYQFRQNVVNAKVECRKKGDGEWEEANENSLFYYCIQNNYNITPNRIGWILNSDATPKFNPFIDYFNGLKWHPSERSEIDRLLKLIKVKGQERFNRHFKKMLVRCIVCSCVTERYNNKYNKHVFVLRSDGQSKGKSHFINWLCPPALKEYHVNNFKFDKDGEIALSTNFMVNLEELQSIASIKTDLEKLKACIQTSFINERLPYGKRRETFPRRCNFFGSTNMTEFLRDLTGSVRWLIFEIENINWEYSDPRSKNFIDINKIWAEAKYLLDIKFDYNLTQQEIEENEKINENHREKTIEEELIIKYFEVDPERKNHYAPGELFFKLQTLALPLGFKVNKRAASEAARKLFGEQEKARKKFEDGKESPRDGYFIRVIGEPT